ncbi:hypothetical protein [Streptomyces sp. NPDC049949]|uniref:hypothetical protein n=1 Tax=Streptomyces sp. NPDC049949 TaxID=3154627 RepID=UPI003424B7AD
MWGPLTQGMNVPNDLDLSDRATALEQLYVSAAVNSRLVNFTKDYIGSERETAPLVSTRAWPLLAARMAGIARGAGRSPDRTGAGRPATERTPMSRTRCGGAHRRCPASAPPSGVHRPGVDATVLGIHSTEWSPLGGVADIVWECGDAAHPPGAHTPRFSLTSPQDSVGQSHWAALGTTCVVK